MKNNESTSYLGTYSVYSSSRDKYFVGGNRWSVWRADAYRWTTLEQATAYIQRRGWQYTSLADVKDGAYAVMS